MARLSKAGLFSLLLIHASGSCAGMMGNDIAIERAYPYFGGNIGITGLADKESTLLPSPAKHRLSATGLLGGGFLGYALPLSEEILVSLEGFGNSVSVNATATQNYGIPEPQYQVDMSYNAGVRLLPSYLITPHTLGYLIVGYSYGQFHIQDNGNYGFVGDTFSENGFQAGLGLKTELAHPLSLRFDLIYTYYGSQTTYGRTLTGFQAYQNNFATVEADLALVYSFSI